MNKLDLVNFGWWLYVNQLMDNGVRLPETLVQLYLDDVRWQDARFGAKDDE